MFFADQSDKWHHSMQRYLGLPDASFLYGVIPGVCREVVGRRDWMYTQPECFNSNKVYVWSEYHAKKLEKSRMQSYYGACPFLWDLAKVATTESYEPEGSLFFIPRDDQVTIRDADYRNVQDAINWASRPIRFLLPWRECDIWKEWKNLKLPKDSEFIQMNDRVNRQFILSRLFLQSEHVYIPWPGTDIYYAEFLGKHVHIYDRLEYYRTKTIEESPQSKTKILRHLKWGWDYLNDTQKEFFEYTNTWSILPEDDRAFMTAKMLGLSQLKSPEDLYNDLLEIGFLREEDKQVVNEEYITAYEWLREKTIKVNNIKCSDRCTDIYATI